MKVMPAWSTKAHEVFAVSKHPSFTDGETKLDNMTFSVLDDQVLEEVKASECTILDPRIDDFVLLPPNFASGLVIMWRPLAEAGIWIALREHDPVALQRFARLRVERMPTDRERQ